MARKQTKKNLVNEYQVVYFGDKETKIGARKIESPIFIKVLKRHLVVLGALTKLPQIPSKSYTTQSGLTQKYYIDEQTKLIWKTQKGQKDGIEYENSEIVDPPIFNNELVLTLIKTSKNSKGTESNIKISLGLPAFVTVTDVAKFIEVFKKALVKWKFGTVTENLQELYTPIRKKATSGGSRKASTPRGAKGKSKSEAPFYIPIGRNTNTTGLLKSGGAGKKSKTESKLVVAVIYNDSAKLLGYGKPKQTEKKNIESGTVFGQSKTKLSNTLIGFDAFEKPGLFSQIWEKVNDDSDGYRIEGLSDPGTGITVKCRYTRNAIASGSKIKKTSEYAYFSVPSGTPKGLIGEFLTQVPSRPRSFQISTGGSYGTSTLIPTRSKGNI
jgi:hypothetical protein